MTSLILGLLVLAQLTPKFSPESLVNAASNTAGPFAPNTLVTLYGENLSFKTRALAAQDLRGNTLPTMLSGTGVRILIANQPANLYYVSPTQVNLLIPSDLLTGVYNFELIRDGLLSPPIPIEIVAESPQFFVLTLPETTGPFAAATHADGRVVDFNHPAHAGEVIIVYATGLGSVRPSVPYGQVATRASSIRKKEEFKVYMNDIDVSSELIEYVGVTPGYGGLFQINIKIPEGTPELPQIRMGFGFPQSVEGVRLVVRSPDTPEAVSDPASLQTKPAAGSR